MEILDDGWRTVLAFHELLPFRCVDPLGICTRGPQVDATDTTAIFAHPIIFSKQSGDPLILGSGSLEDFGDVSERGRLRQIKCDDGNDHRSLLAVLRKNSRLRRRPSTRLPSYSSWGRTCAAGRSASAARGPIATAVCPGGQNSLRDRSQADRDSVQARRAEWLTTDCRVVDRYQSH